MNNAEPTVAAVLRSIGQQLSSRFEAELLLAGVLKCDRARLFAHPETVLSKSQLKQLNELTAQRIDGVPIAYLLGVREFYGREFIVNPSVLIPRPETELLVEQALKLPVTAQAHVLDIGTGSGCIILTLAAERPDWHFTATDISAQALATAQRNQRRLDLGDRSITWRKGSGYKAFAAQTNHRFDLIVSNPPYVAEQDPHLTRGDLRFEPDIALTAGPSGLELIDELIDQAPAHLNPGGWLLLEHGYDQSEQVCEQMQQIGFDAVQSRQDLAGHYRVAMGCWQR